METKLGIKEINVILEDLLNEDLNEISVESDNFEMQLDQGSIGRKTQVFQVSDDLFIKMVTTSNSYSTVNGIKSIAFVKPVKKEVTVYETI